MRQLPGVHSSFLYMENSRTIGHVCGMMIVDPSPEPQEILPPPAKPTSEPVPSEWGDARPGRARRDSPSAQRNSAGAGDCEGRRAVLAVRSAGEPQGSYRDAIDFGVVSTPEMPDIWNLIEYLTQELDEFHAVD